MPAGYTLPRSCLVHILREIDYIQRGDDVRITEIFSSCVIPFPRRISTLAGHETSSLPAVLAAALSTPQHVNSNFRNNNIHPSTVTGLFLNFQNDFTNWIAAFHASKFWRQTKCENERLTR